MDGGTNVIGRLKLGTKFTLLLMLVFLSGIVLSGVTLSSAMQRKAENEVMAKAEILTHTINSVREYTSNNVVPLLKDRLETSPKFIGEIVPSFAARKVFENFRDRPEYKSFLYKEAALNPTNLHDRADEFETKLLQQFRTQPDLTQLSGYQAKEGKIYFSLLDQWC